MKTERQIANERHMKMVAEKLNGRECGLELADHEEKQLESIGLVVAFGYSDDNVEFRGAMSEEIGCWEDITIPILDGEILKQCSEDCDDYDCPLWKDALSRAKNIRATQFSFCDEYGCGMSLCPKCASKLRDKINELLKEE